MSSCESILFPKIKVVSGGLTRPSKTDSLLPKNSDYYSNKGYRVALTRFSSARDTSLKKAINF